jgi:amyloid beta precursor protein binding protein 1
MTTDVDKKRYDRQIRIWGAHGQGKLQNARVCLLNAGPTGSETLKNLVLGGIAGFVIVDEAKVIQRTPPPICTYLHLYSSH